MGVALGGIPFRLSGWVSRTLRSTAYSASKGAVRLFTKSTAIQYASEGIRANSIHPGPIDTAMGDQVWPPAPPWDGWAHLRISLMAPFIWLRRSPLSSPAAN